MLYAGMQMMPGNELEDLYWYWIRKRAKEATNTAFNYLKANGNRISGQIGTTTKIILSIIRIWWHWNDRKIWHCRH